MSGEWPVVPNDEVGRVCESYADLLAWYERTVGHPAVVVAEPDGKGGRILRFRPNKLYLLLKPNLNTLCGQYQNGLFTLAEYAEFVAGMGYSLSGFCDLSFFAESIWPGSSGDAAADELDALTDAQRLEVFGRYCVHCGRKDPRCQCWNDE